MGLSLVSLTMRLFRTKFIVLFLKLSQGPLRQVLKNGIFHLFGHQGTKSTTNLRNAHLKFQSSKSSLGLHSQIFPFSEKESSSHCPHYSHTFEVSFGDQKAFIAVTVVAKYKEEAQRNFVKTRLRGCPKNWFKLFFFNQETG